MELSTNAKNVLAKLEEVRQHAYTEKFVTDHGDGEWVEAMNAANGWHPEIPEEFEALMISLSEVLCGELISQSGQHSPVFYELKRAGYRLRTGESDSFGPLSSVIVIPGTNWSICYG